MFLRIALTIALITGSLTAPDSAAAAAAARGIQGSVRAVAVGSSGSLSAAAASAAGCSPATNTTATTTPQQAINKSVSKAAASSVVQSISVLDRSTGRQLGRTTNADSQIASESIMKLLLASYYLVLYGGYSKTPADVRSRLSYMLRYSDDATASALFTANAIPTIAARYGLGRTTNATDRAGHWGAARITAREMTVFLYKASKDSAVGPWLIPVMAQTAASGSDGFNQKFGMNALTGTHGSKQGWGADSYWTSRAYAIHSVGYTAKYFVAILQIGPSTTYADPMRGLATTGAQWIKASGSSLANGTFIKVAGSSNVYRIAGGAPLYVASWAPWGKAQPVVTITRAEYNTLSQYPAAGTFVQVRQSGNLYRIAGNAAIRITSWSGIGGPKPAVQIDGRAITLAGTSSVYRHLRAEPVEGTFLRVYSSGNVYRVVGNAPIFVSSWSALGGEQCSVNVDSRAISLAGTGTHRNLSKYPRSGTYLRAWSSKHVYRVAGGAPLFVPGTVSQGTPINVDAAAISNSGRPGAWSHLRFYPVSGTFIRGTPGSKVYRVIGGVAHHITSWAPYGGQKPTVTIAQKTIDRAGSASPYNHLRKG